MLRNVVIGFTSPRRALQMQWLPLLVVVAIVQAAGSGNIRAADTQDRELPNIVLMMADDMGWGDTGFNGGKIIKTPHLDTMAADGMKFTRFYAGAPVCSPTRGSFLTGRHPYRYGISTANSGHLRKGELCLAELLKQHGYTTGHFGKWHLGTLSPDFSGKGARRKPRENYCTPGMSGFDYWFSTEYAVSTWDPYRRENVHGSEYDMRNFYYRNGKNLTGDEIKTLTGCDSRIIMDEALPFIETAVKTKQPFFAVIWFHAPHAPVVAGPEYLAMYKEHNENARHYYGCITALDEQVGRLRNRLKELNVEQNTIVTFCSDNGPEGSGRGIGGKLRSRQRFYGSAGPFRGRKRSLYEGGVRVPSVVVWPAKVKAGSVTKYPAVTSDYLPTVVETIGAEPPENRPLDGVSLLNTLTGKAKLRDKPIGFHHQGRESWVDNQYKLIGKAGGDQYELYDLLSDPGEANNIAAEHPQIVDAMRKQLVAWRQSCRSSAAGKDY